MSKAIKLKNFKRNELLAIAFYFISGIILLVSLPLAAFAPHLALLGIISLIAGYSLLTKRAWAPWLVAILFIVVSVFTIFTLLSIGFSNALVALSMIGYVVFTWLATIYLLLKRRT